MDTHEVTGTMKEVQGKAERTYGIVRDTLNQETAGRFENFADQARENIQSRWEESIELVKENPASALGISLLIGAVLGALLVVMTRD